MTVLKFKRNPELAPPPLSEAHFLDAPIYPAERSVHRSTSALMLVFALLIISLIALNHKSPNNHDLGAPTLKRMVEIYPRVTEGEYFNLVKAVGLRLIGALPEDEQQGWIIALIRNDHPMTLALPGRTIIISDGNQKIAPNAHMVATLLAHEIAHSLNQDPDAAYLKTLYQTLGPTTTSTWLSVQSRPSVHDELDYESAQLQSLLRREFNAKNEQAAELMALSLVQEACLDAEYGALTWRRLYKAAPAMAHRHGPMLGKNLQAARVKGARHYRRMNCKAPPSEVIPKTAAQLLSQSEP